MNKETLQQRLNEVEASINQTNAAIQQHVANLNMLQGNRNELFFWLKSLEESQEISLEQFHDAAENAANEISKVEENVDQS